MCAAISVEIMLNDVPVTMEVDTRTSSTIINQLIFRCIQQNSLLDHQPSEFSLKTCIPVRLFQKKARYNKQVNVVVQLVTGI